MKRKAVQPRASAGGRGRRPQPRSYSIWLGASRAGASGGRFSATDDVIIRTITLRHFPEGFTILEAMGGWFDALKGKFVREESRQIMVVTNSPKRLQPWCAELARAVKQKELLVTEGGPVISFRAGPGS